VGSNLISSNILDGNGIKAMPGSIPALFQCRKIRKNTGSQMGHAKKDLKKDNAMQLLNADND